MINFYIEVEGQIDSKELYSKIKQFNVNVLDIKDKTIVQGKVNDYVFIKILKVCQTYGCIAIVID